MSEAVGRAYDARAEEYVARFGDLADLAEVDRALVARWRGSTTGVLLDAGCGPGTWGGLLKDGGRTVVGVDVSTAFLAHARATRAETLLARASLEALPLRDGDVGGVLAWYSTIHLEPVRLPGALAELGRVLAPGGSLLLGYFPGPPGEPFDHAVTTAYSWSVDALRGPLAAGGLDVVEDHRRHEAGSRPLGALVARRTR